MTTTAPASTPGILARGPGPRRRPVWPSGWRLGLLLLAACTPPIEPGEEPASSFVYVSPDPIGVNPFLLLGSLGLERAAAKHGADSLVLESEDPTTRAENVRAAIDGGADLLIVLGFEFADLLEQLAPVYPEVEFVIVDQCIEEPPGNVTCAVFREFEASFLIGAVAAALSESGHVAVLGALDIPFLHRYTDGFTAGARHREPQIEVSVRWVGGESPFSDPVRAKELALGLAAAGADVLFAATAAGNFGVFEAALEQDLLVFGHDVDQCGAARGQVVDNLLKRVDVVIEETVDRVRAGGAERLAVYGLESRGVDLIALADPPPAQSDCVIFEHPEVLELVRQLRPRVIAGELGIEDPMGIL